MDFVFEFPDGVFEKMVIEQFVGMLIADDKIYEALVLLNKINKEQDKINEERGKQYLFLISLLLFIQILMFVFISLPLIKKSFKNIKYFINQGANEILAIASSVNTKSE